MKNIGSVIVDLTKTTDKGSVSSVIARALSSVPAGRNLVVMWQQGAEWAPRPPIESWVTQVVLGIPLERAVSEVDFFGNGVIRIYKANSTSPSSTWHWLSFRRQGDRAYSRRKTASQDALNASTLSTLDPVFTRDAANNVWHMTAKSARSQIIERFQVLLSWSDEDVLLVTGHTSKVIPYPRVSFNEGLIGVASKTPYSWI